MRKSPLYPIFFTKWSLWNITRKNLTKSKPVPPSKTGPVRAFVQVTVTNVMFVASHKATLMFRRENSRSKTEVAEGMNMTGTHRSKNHILLHLSRVFLLCFLAAAPQTAAQSDSSCTNYPACRLLSRWVLPMREDRAAGRGAATVSPASPQCCLLTLVAPDWVRVPGNETACMCINTICFRALQPAFLKSNRWTSAEGDTRNSLHLSDSPKTLYACAATGDLTFIVGLSPSCRGAAASLQNVHQDSGSFRDLCFPLEEIWTNLPIHCPYRSFINQEKERMA